MANKNVLELNTENWDKEVVQSDKPVLVDFWAPWCGPCRQMGPTIDKIADQFVGKVKVGKLNVDDNQDLAAQFGISSIPVVLFFKGGGQPKDKMVGLSSESSFVKMINRNLEV